ncbi:FIMAH domain-containing protein [Myceligenerans pegani]|uniref:FIMAH domain-containing protein n=1 Tax=Myceligenerans pegani TaxID=2776917 RepID=UPI0038CC1400
MVPKLTHALDQAQGHLDRDQLAQAVKAFHRFVEHLKRPRYPDTVSDTAREVLIDRATTVSLSLS